MRSKLEAPSYNNTKLWPIYDHGVMSRNPYNACTHMMIRFSTCKISWNLLYSFLLKFSLAVNQDAKEILGSLWWPTKQLAWWDKLTARMIWLSCYKCTFRACESLREECAPAAYGDHFFLVAYIAILGKKTNSKRTHLIWIFFNYTCLL